MPQYVVHLGIAPFCIVWIPLVVLALRLRKKVLLLQNEVDRLRERNLFLVLRVRGESPKALLALQPPQSERADVVALESSPARDKWAEGTVSAWHIGSSVVTQFLVASAIFAALVGYLALGRAAQIEAPADLGPRAESTSQTSEASTTSSPYETTVEAMITPETTTNLLQPVEPADIKPIESTFPPIFKAVQSINVSGPKPTKRLGPLAGALLQPTAPSVLNTASPTRATLSCLPSALAVRQGRPGAWPSWSLRAPGHEGEKCWYAATRSTAHNHRSSLIGAQRHEPQFTQESTWWEG